jgi:molybdate transport system ATP-binding protein
MLEVDVSKTLRGVKLATSFKIDHGETLMLIGENGCGKTTLLNMIAGLTLPDSGEIVLSGRILFDAEDGINLPPEERNIGYVFQNYALFPHMSVYDNVAFGLRTRRLSKTEVEEKVNRQLKDAGLWDLRNSKASKISGGEKQRVALARALITKPRLLLLDEPLAALDIKRRALMRKELKTIINEYDVPSIIVTHDLRDVLGIGDKVCLLEEGRIAFLGKAEEVLNEKDPSGPSI